MKLFKNMRLALIAVLVLIGANASAQLAKSQAAYIYNFTRFIEWPASAGSGDFVIGVLGKNTEIAKELNASSTGRNVGGKSVKIVEFANADEIQSCQILFVPDMRSSLLSKVEQKFGAQPMAVISEEQDWNPAESTINLMVVDSKLAFHVNQKNAGNKQLKLSEKLIALSK
jgi:hypothetical protein